MRLKFNVLFVAACLLLFLTASNIFAQKAKPATAKKPLISAVIQDGKTLEPIAYLTGGKLSETVDGSDATNIIVAFNRSYYPKGKVYSLIFGGKSTGTATVVSSNANSDCSKNMATATTKTSGTALKGHVMALATDAQLKKPGSGVRRMPTTQERAEIDALAKAEFIKNGVSDAVANDLRYLNNTGLDVDNDAKVEFVGTYWTYIGPTERGLLFVIADKGSDGKYVFGYSEYRKVIQSEVMSGDIKDLDNGVYHERLLDIFDTDGDGISEIFSYVQGFEGSTFNVYRRQAAAWTNIFEGANYHCGY